MELVSDAGKVVLNYGAKTVNVVAAGNSVLSLKIDRESIDRSDIGSDVRHGTVPISEERLYNLVFSDEYGRHLLEVEVDGEGFKLYTFTFG
jgi:DNA-binding protein YbaB